MSYKMLWSVQLRNVHEITFASLYGAQVFSLHCKRRTKDPRPKVAQVISCSFLSGNPVSSIYYKLTDSFQPLHLAVLYV